MSQTMSGYTMVQVSRIQPAYEDDETDMKMYERLSKLIDKKVKKNWVLKGDIVVANKHHLYQIMIKYDDDDNDDDDDDNDDDNDDNDDNDDDDDGKEKAKSSYDSNW